MILFSSLLSILVIYFVFLRRRFDCFSIAFIGFFVYFSPFIFEESILDHEVYILLLIPLSIFLGASVFFDSIIKTRPKLSTEHDFFNIKKLLFSLSILSLITFTFIAYQAGLSLILSAKTERAYNVFVYGLFISFVTTGFVYSLSHNLKIYKIIFSFFILFLVASADRTAVVMCFLAVFGLYMRNANIRMINFLMKPLVIASSLSIFIIGVYGKFIFALIVLASVGGDIHSFADYYFYDNSILDSIKKTEPFHTAGMLTYVFNSEFRMDSSYLFEVFFHFLPVSGPLTDSLHHFSEVMKSNFYSGWGDEQGVAGNFWAEGYANFGVFGVIVFSLIHSFVTFFLNYFYFKTKFFYGPVILLMGAFWGFYIHRNSLFMIISHEKRVFYGFLLAVIFSKIISGLLNERKN